MKPVLLVNKCSMAMFLFGLLLLPASRATAQLPNAWQINDNYSGGVSVIEYIKTIPSGQVLTANSFGWHYSLVSRMVSDSGSPACQSMAYGNGTTRFYVFFDLDASGQLTAQLLGSPNINLTLTTDTADATNYHTHDLTYDPATGKATYRFDGRPLATWAGNASTGQANQVMWGANNSTGRGVMNYLHADFEINAVGVVANYDAGTAGNPATAPSPTTQGWSRYQSGNPAILESAVSPDVIGLAKIFADVGAGFPPVKHGAAAWGDYNNDGWLDVAICGTTNADASGAICRIFRNSPEGFSDGGVSLPGVMDGSLNWGDYDRDGRLDLLITGIGTNGYIAQVWRNTGSGFTNINAGLQGVGYGSATWGDYDNDGLPDILLTGYYGGYVCHVYRNTGNGFTNIFAGLPNIGFSSAAWGDYDNDGRLDIALSGTTSIVGGSLITQIWRNTGNGFTNANVALPGLYSSSVAWGDYDNDGLLDLLLTGYDHTNSHTEIFRNTGSGFTNIAAGITPVSSGSARWGDYDNDGLPDVLIVGSSNGVPKAEIWRNTGAGFTNMQAALPALLYGKAAWGDANNDGRLDVLLAGGFVSANAGVFQNVQPYRNTPPNPPLNLTAVSAPGGGVELNWSPGSDAQTPSNGLSYNIRVGTTLDAGDVVNSASDGFGFIRTARMGNAQLGTNALVFPTNGSFQWSVQAVDGAFAGSQFGAIGSFGSPTVTTLAATDVRTFGATLEGTLNPGQLATEYWFDYGTTTNYGNTSAANTAAASADSTPVSISLNGLARAVTYHYRLAARNGVGTVVGDDLTFTTASHLDLSSGAYDGSVAWGDYDNDGLMDVLIVGSRGSNLGLSDVLRNTGNSFTNIAAGLTPVTSGHAVWGDYDNDGSLDILLCGRTNDFGGSAIDEIWRNTGTGFTNIHAGLPALGDNGAWGDFDNDGRRDLVLTGVRSGVAVAELWRNTGNGFVKAYSLPGRSGGAVAWGDFDNDGRLDLLLTGADEFNRNFSEIWRNTGGGFTNINAGLRPLIRGSAVWGDYDNDGRLDLLLAGYDGTNDFTQVWHNTGAGFALADLGLPNVGDSAARWGDYDNDGKLDVLLVGHDATRGDVCEVWRNTGAGFTNLNLGIPGYNGLPGADWGDASGDGRLDIVLSGFQASSPYTLLGQVWFNDHPAADTPPSAPTGLSSSIQPPFAVLSWNPGSDAETPSAGLSYNVRIGTSPGASDVLGPQASAAGRRRLPALGNAQSRTNTRVALAAGTYYWSVQSQDGAFVGSAFLAEGSFTTPALPLVFTHAASEIQPNAAMLNAAINPNGLATTYYFEWGLTTNYGTFTATNSLPAGTDFAAVSAQIVGLKYNTHYHFRIVASNGAGVLAGDDQEFVTPSLLALESYVYQGAAAWGDFDNDGRLDLVLTGQTNAFTGELGTLMLRNTGNGFSNITTAIPGLQRSAVAWGDYDNDGRLDLLIAGENASHDPVTQIWRNTGNGFTNINAGLPGIYACAVAWGDFDNDGRLDIILGGGAVVNGSAEQILQIWRNTGSGFALMKTPFTGLYYGAVVCADFDNDGWLDFACEGVDFQEPYFVDKRQVWRNTGNGFVLVTNLPPAYSYGAMSWGDFDGDGRLDLLSSGEASNAVNYAEIWRNTANGFTNIDANLTGAHYGSTAWGDYDNDGRPDALLTGYINDALTGIVSDVWQNSASGFTQLDLGLPSSANGTAAFGDFNSDGRLDVLLAPAVVNNSIGTAVWINDSPDANTPPTAPGGLTAHVNGSEVQLAWNPATDAESPSGFLSYNIRIGTTPGGSDVVNPEADASGVRLLPALGNAYSRTNAILFLPGGNYYWTVQAIDPAFAGGPFASEGSFTMPDLPPALDLSLSGTNAILSWHPPFAGWFLQEDSTLASDGWTNAPGGDANPVTLPLSPPTKFYRLVRP